MLTQEGPTVMVRWPVVRVKEGRETQVQLLSGDWVRLVTHFFRRTFLCSEGAGCVACELLPQRAYWYLPVVSLQTQRPSILEMSARASGDLEQRCRFAGYRVGPGVQVELARRSKKAPLRMELIGQATCPSVARLDEWVSCLMALYCLPALKPGETLDAYGERSKQTVERRAALMRMDMESAAARGVGGR